MKHTTQYAVVGTRGNVAFDSALLSDAECRQKAHGRAKDTVERFNRCPVCEEWTTHGGVLRTDLECPAVLVALGGVRPAATGA